MNPRSPLRVADGFFGVLRWLKVVDLVFMLALRPSFKVSVLQAR
jgi:hypothetical protein